MILKCIYKKILIWALLSTKYLFIYCCSQYDAVLLSEDAQGLQQMLDSLHVYCNKWSLTVNVDKTKILVFHESYKYSCWVKHYVHYTV